MGSAHTLTPRNANLGHRFHFFMLLLFPRFYIWKLSWQPASGVNLGTRKTQGPQEAAVALA